MGTYGVKTEELIEPLKNFLGEQEGDVSAEVMTEAWNKLAKRYDWKDRLFLKRLMAKKSKLIKPLLHLYQALQLDLDNSTLKMMSGKCTKKDELTWMYDKGSMVTYKKIMEILEKEGLVTIGKKGR